MTLLAAIEAAGFAVALAPGGKLSITPASRLTADQREKLRANRDAIVAELEGRRGKAPPPLPALRERGTPYVGGPFDPARHRAALEAFWATGWTPLGGWKPGERAPKAGSAGSG